MKDVVTYRDERYLTLKQVFESLDLTAYDLSIDTLDMHAHRDAFHRFDRFNAKYSERFFCFPRKVKLETQEIYFDMRKTPLEKVDFVKFSSRLTITSKGPTWQK